MTPLPHSLDRTITIRAPREIVFAYFTDDARWSAWWGSGSTIDARPGGAVLIRYPNGVEVRGDVLVLDPPSRIVFTYGYASGAPIAPGESRVTIVLEDAGRGRTRLSLRHEFADAAARDLHVQGWRYQLSVFSNLVSNDRHASAAAAADAWFAIWADPDAESRARMLAAVAAPDVTFADKFSALAGHDDLLPHIAASQQFMPGVRLTRTGHARQCQGTVLTDWIATGADGREIGRGTNVFTLDGEGRIESVTGFWT